MSIMDMFKSVISPAPVVQQQPQQVQGTPGNIPVNPTVTSVPGNPTSPQIPQQQQQEVSPLDAFKDLWKTDPNKKPNSSQQLFNVNPDELLKSASAVNFKSVITPEIAARIKAGGEDGMAAMQDAMNVVAQNTYAQSAMATTKIVEAAIKQTREEFKKELPALIKSQNVRNSFAEENPALSHPSVQPLVNTLQSQFQTKHPTASPAEIRSMVNDYMNGISEIVSQQKQKNNPPEKQSGFREDTDWSKFG